MRIGFTGTHGTGKSTLLREMFGWPELNGYGFFSGSTRLLAKQGVKINQEGDFPGQLSIAKCLGYKLGVFQHLVLDRTLIDVHAYSMQLHKAGKIPKPLLDDLYQRSTGYQRHFDKVFHIKPEFPVEGDDFRSSDAKYASEIADYIEELIQDENFSTPYPVINISGTVEERLETIREHLFQ